MRQAVPVTIGTAEFLVETVRAPEDDGGIVPVGADPAAGTETFERVRDMIQAVSGELVAAWENSGASEATVEFGIAADVRAGRLTGLLVGGTTSASFNVTLKWTSDPGT